MEIILTWVAPVATILAALMTASNLGSRITGTGFAVFAIGSLAWLALGIIGDNPALLWMNAVLTLLNLFGIWRWLGRQGAIESGAVAAIEASEPLAEATLFPASLFTRGKLLDTVGDEMAVSIDAMLNNRSGQPAYLVISQGGIAGVGETFRRMPWSEVCVVGDDFHTSLVASELVHYAQLEKDKWPGR